MQYSDSYILGGTFSFIFMRNIIPLYHRNLLKTRNMKKLALIITGLFLLPVMAIPQSGGTGTEADPY
jgi:hypothetical protein